jgi:hypothetical protein
VRQQLEDGAFVFPACDFLRDKLGNSADSKHGARTVTPSGSNSRTNRRAPPADEVINSQKDLFPKDPNDNWQVYLDHVRSGPVPNMCCRWHLNGKCRESFLRDSHVALTTEQIASVREWIKQCRARMRRPTHAEGPGKKQKLGTSEPAYSRSTFVAAPSKWSAPSIATLAGFSNRSGQPAGSSPHTHTSRQDDSPFHKRRPNADASPVRPTANSTTTVRGSPTDQRSSADASPFRPYVATTPIVRWSPPYRHDPSKFASTFARTEPHKPGPQTHRPASGVDSHRPTRHEPANVTFASPVTRPEPHTPGRAKPTPASGVDSNIPTSGCRGSATPAPAQRTGDRRSVDTPHDNAYARYSRSGRRHTAIR